MPIIPVEGTGGVCLKMETFSLRPQPCRVAGSVLGRQGGHRPLYPDTCSCLLILPGTLPPSPTSASCAPPEDVRPEFGRSFLGPFPRKAGRTLGC